MAVSTQISSPSDHQVALARVEKLMGAEVGTPESEELSDLAAMVDEYESQEFNFGTPDGVDVIEFELDQGRTELSELLPIFGDESAFADYMMRERDIGPAVAQELADLLGRPAEHFTVPLRRDANPEDVLGGGLEWHHALDAMVARRAAAA